VTVAAVAVVAVWAARPVSGPWEYRASVGGRASLRHPVTYEGFASPEPWGRWTTGEEATLTFGRALPTRFEAVLRAHAFGANAGAPIRVCAGGGCQSATFAQADTDVRLTFHVRPNSHRVTLHIPHPSAPGNGDNRRFGVGLVSVRIEDAR
jgi:phosphoglycerol transferase